MYKWLVVCIKKKKYVKTLIDNNVDNYNQKNYFFITKI